MREASITQLASTKDVGKLLFNVFIVRVVIFGIEVLYFQVAITEGDTP